jgi:hypothetical protein
MLQTSFIVNTTNCNTFVFTETTGAISGTNLTGWGIPNQELSEVQDSILTITNLLTGEVFEPIEVNPSENDTVEILYADLILQGQTTPTGNTTIKDGIYHFNYFILFDDNSTIVANFYVLSLCHLECKLKSLTNTFINLDCKDCGEVAILNLFLEAMSLYQALLFSYQCGNFCDFNKIYNNLTKLLKAYKCKTC